MGHFTYFECKYLQCRILQNITGLKQKTSKVAFLSKMSILLLFVIKPFKKFFHILSSNLNFTLLNQKEDISGIFNFEKNKKKGEFSGMQK